MCVLSGGSAKGAAHIGAIKALDDWGQSPAHYVGTSIGSVIAACFASGLKYDEVVRRITSLSRRDVAAISPWTLLGPYATSLFKGSTWREAIEMLVPARRFGDLHTPLTVTAVDAASGDLTLFGDGGEDHVPLIDALYASCALPLYFPPARIGGRLYLDGGLRAVLPLDVADLFEPDLVFGVQVGPGSARAGAPSAAEADSPGLLRAHTRSMRILMSAQAQDTISRWKRERSDRLVLVEPKIEGRGVFAVDRLVGYVEQGYRAAHRALVEWTTQ